MSLGLREVLTTLALVAVVLAVLLWGNRPSPEKFARVNRLTLDDETCTTVAGALRRTYRGRLLGGGAGFLLAVLFAVLSGTSLTFTRGLAAVLGGTLIGIALAQFTRAPASGAVRIASLEARDAEDYRPRGAKWSIGIALAILIGYAGAFLLISATGAMAVIVNVVAAAGVGVVGLGTWLQRRIVEHAQVRTDADHAEVDDALRASAVRAVHHATIGLLLCGIAFLGITGAGWGPIEVHVNDKTAFEIAPGASDVVQGRDTIWWTAFDGTRHTRTIPSDQGQISGWRRTYESSAVSIIGVLLALFAGSGALIEWREAARAWRRPGPRRLRRRPTRSGLTPARRPA
jgi:hypothetical protein